MIWGLSYYVTKRSIKKIPIALSCGILLFGKLKTKCSGRSAD